MTRPRSPWRRRLGLAALLGTALLAALIYTRAQRYVERDPAFCALCHERNRAFDLWTDSAHRKIRCQSCHHESKRDRLSMLLGYVFRGPPPARGDASGSGSGSGSGRGSGSGSGDSPVSAARAHTKKPAVALDACQSCHARHDHKWSKTSQSIGHRVHLDARALRKRVTCLSCHVRSAHRLTDPLQSCAQCHRDATRGVDKMQRLHCNACHQFLAHGTSLRPTQATCNDCHRSRKVARVEMRAHGAMGQFNCSACHRPHAKAGARRVPCENCHERVATFGLHANAEHRTCKSCHVPHAWTPTQTRCKSCHADVKHKSEPPAQKACWSCHRFDRESKAEADK